MSTLSFTIRERIQAQGFCGLEEATYSQINYPLRLSPAICMIWAAVGMALASSTVLWALAPFALLGAVLRGHPFDVIYNYGLRHLSGVPELPRYGARRRFGCTSATAMLIAAGWSFHMDHLIAGYIIGGLLVTAAFVNVSTGICIPALIARLCFGKVVCEQFDAAMLWREGIGTDMSLGRIWSAHMTNGLHADRFGVGALDTAT